MVEALDKARYQSLDRFDGEMIPTSWMDLSGSQGRPKIAVDMNLLGAARRLRPLSKVASTFNCSARTLRRRLLEAGLVEPGPPVAVSRVQPDGTVLIEYTATRAAMSEISDEELDQVVARILQAFPDLGRSMLRGALRDQGYRISPKRQRQSYIRVHGAPGVFGARRIARRRYKVPGANSLWHHDGQHGKYCSCPNGRRIT